MNSRQKELLEIVVDDYVREARPISSGYLVSQHRLSYSPATVRNELAELLDSGYLKKIYFSSGNVPTNKAYRLVVDGVLADQPKLTETEMEEEIESLERAVSFLSREFGALTAGVDSELNLFLDGIDELFGQPDFQTKNQYQLLGRLVEWLQDMHSVIAKPKRQAIFVGRDNPFWDESDELSWLVGSSPDSSVSIVSIGPTRMPYRKNWKTFCEILNNF